MNTAAMNAAARAAQPHEWAQAQSVSSASASAAVRGDTSVQASGASALEGLQNSPLMKAAAQPLTPVSDGAKQNAKLYFNNVHYNDASYFTSPDALLRNIAYARTRTQSGTQSGTQPETQSGAQAGTAQKSGVSSLMEPKDTCNSCAERTYVDGSNDGGVSYQAAKGMPASVSGARVASHEGEHVTRETAKAQREGKQIVEKKVSLHMAFCPDCGRMYTAGGTTSITTREDEDDAQSPLSVQNVAEMLLGAGESMDERV